MARLLAFLLQLWSLWSLVPMTEIEPTSVELEAFSATLTGAMKKLKLKRKEGVVVHVVGASIESKVSWAKFCEKGVTIVLIGPRLITNASSIATNETSHSCVVTVEGLYSHDLLGAEHANPSMVMLFNADVYMPYWRRTLAELLQLGKPVIVTMYCEFEGHKLQRLFKWPEIEFGRDALEQADQMVTKIYDKHASIHRTAGSGAVPQAITLWDFQPNPHAHEPPKNCYIGDQHGVRNSYWVGFKGDKPKMAKDGL